MTALDRALRSLSIRAHTQKEITEKLRIKGYTEPEISQAMEKLVSYHLIDDDDFAEKWSRSRAQRGYGNRRIEAELINKGIQKERIQKVLEALDPDERIKTATTLALKKIGRNGKEAQKKAFDFLLRRGYSYDEARKAVFSALKELEDMTP